MVRNYDYLSQSIISAYGNRKEPGRVSIFTDLRDNNIYIVPRNEEHIDFVKRIASPSEYEKIVPTHIDLRTAADGIEEVIRVITGESGLEIKGGVKHSYEDLQKAHDLAWQFIDKGCVNGEIRIGKIEENKIVERYLLRNTYK